MGCSRRLKEFNPDIQVIAVEPHLGHKIQGLKSLKEAYVPGIFDKRLVDQKVNVADEDAFETARRFAKVEGMLVGMSAGAVVFAALKLGEAAILDADGQGVIVLLDDILSELDDERAGALIDFVNFGDNTGVAFEDHGIQNVIFNILTGPLCDAIGRLERLEPWSGNELFGVRKMFALAKRFNFNVESFEERIPV